METVLRVVVMILVTLPPLAILIPIVLIDALIRLLRGIGSHASGKKDRFLPGAYLEKRPEPHG